MAVKTFVLTKFVLNQIFFLTEEIVSWGKSPIPIPQFFKKMLQGWLMVPANVGSVQFLRKASSESQLSLRHPVALAPYPD